MRKVSVAHARASPFFPFFHTTHTKTAEPSDADMAAYEVIPAFALIVGAIGLMGGLQGAIHKGFFGKPKATSVDSWDRMMNKRDERIKEEAKA